MMDGSHRNRRAEAIVEALRETVDDRDARIVALLHVIDLRDARIGDLEREVGQLEEALRSRATIDQAKGVLMASMRCSPEEAFDLLVEQSNHQNVKLRDVARSIVDFQGRRPAGEPRKEGANQTVVLARPKDPPP